jgi:hypothetical protein
LDVAVTVHESQPIQIIIKNVASLEAAVTAALKMCWEKYPGYFSCTPESEDSQEFNGKYLQDGFPIVEKIHWH